ncbi:MAG: hypothetical protein IT238_05835 [Bacteroidia bacterium]|nr:hypothetical protein [Bacteroidia bacterium]
MKRIKYPYYVIIILLFALSTGTNSCRKEIEKIKVPDIGYDYFPSQKGHYVIYDVDSLFYNDFTSTIDTFKFQVKEKITDTFVDLENRITQRIERFYRENSNDNWVIKDVWYSNKTANTAERVEENMRFVKIVFPLKKDNQWNGNRYNNLGEQNYKLLKIHEFFSLGLLSFDSTITIRHAADSNLIEKNISYEIYARNVGLVYKKNLQLADRDTVVNYTLPFEERANSGFDLTYKAISSGVE